MPESKTTLDDLLGEYIELHSKVATAVMFAETMSGTMANTFSAYSDKLRDRRIAVYKEIEKQIFGDDDD